MKRLSAVIVGLGLFFIATQAQAGEWVAFSSVSGMHSEGDEIHFKTDTYDETSPCNWKNTWSLEKTHPMYDEIFRMLLSATTTGKPGMVAGNGQCDPGNNKQRVQEFLFGTW